MNTLSQTVALVVEPVTVDEYNYFNHPLTTKEMRAEILKKAKVYVSVYPDSPEHIAFIKEQTA